MFRRSSRGLPEVLVLRLFKSPGKQNKSDEETTVGLKIGRKERWEGEGLSGFWIDIEE